MVGNKRGEIRKEVILRIIMLLLSALVLFPFLYCVAYSLSDSVAVMTTQITIFPLRPMPFPSAACRAAGGCPSSC